MSPTAKTLPTTLLFTSPVFSAPALCPHDWVQHPIYRYSEFTGEISTDLFLCYFYILTERRKKYNFRWFKLNYFPKLLCIYQHRCKHFQSSTRGRDKLREWQIVTTIAFMFAPSLPCCLSQFGVPKQDYHRLGDLNNKHLFLTVLEAESGEKGEGEKERESERALSWLSLIMVLTPS